jgi:hypothetical protein
MDIFAFAAVLMVSGWLGLAVLLWASFKEDARVHPIYRMSNAGDRRDSARLRFGAGGYGARVQNRRKVVRNNSQPERRNLAS